MSDLTEFLLARVAEDEAVARAATPGPWVVGRPFGQVVIAVTDGRKWRSIADAYGSDANTAHIARHDPARVLAECEAKRRIVATMQTANDQAWQDGASGPVIEFIAARVLRLLAQPYAEHEQFREEWRP